MATASDARLSDDVGNRLCRTRDDSLPMRREASLRGEKKKEDEESRKIRRGPGAGSCRRANEAAVHPNQARRPAQNGGARARWAVGWNFLERSSKRGCRARLPGRCGVVGVGSWERRGRVRVRLPLTLLEHAQPAGIAAGLAGCFGAGQRSVASRRSRTPGNLATTVRLLGSFGDVLRRERGLACSTCGVGMLDCGSQTTPGMQGLPSPTGLRIWFPRSTGASEGGRATRRNRNFSLQRRDNGS